MYASAVCSGKVKSKANGGAIASNKLSQKRKKVSHLNKGGIARGCGGVMEKKRKRTAVT